MDDGEIEREGYGTAGPGAPRYLLDSRRQRFTNRNTEDMVLAADLGECVALAAIFIT